MQMLANFKVNKNNHKTKFNIVFALPIYLWQLQKSQFAVGHGALYKHKSAENNKTILCAMYSGTSLLRSPWLSNNTGIRLNSEVVLLLVL